MRSHSRILAVTLCFLASPGAAFGEEVKSNGKLDDSLRKVAARWAEVFKEKSVVKVALGDIKSDPNIESASGPGIKASLEKLIKEQGNAAGFTVDTPAPFTLDGKVKLITKDAGTSLMKITLDLRDQNDDTILSLTSEISDNTDIAKLAGVTATLPPNYDDKSRNKIITQAALYPMKKLKDDYIPPEKPPAGETKARMNKDSPFAVEFLVKGKDEAVARPRPIQLDEKGRFFVTLKPDDTYHLNLYNETAGDQKFEAAVTIKIDGLDVFKFSEVKNDKGEPKYSHFLISPNSKPSTIFGWHKTNKLMLDFLITEYGKGAVSAQKAPRDQVGIVTVTFAAAYPKDVARDQLSGRDASGDLETGFGAKRDVDLKEKEATFGKEQALISIRYKR